MRNIIELAQSRGSSATTHAGAKRYLIDRLAKNHSTTPLHRRGARVYSRDRSEFARIERTRRAEKLCLGLGHWPLDLAESVAGEIEDGLLAQYRSAIESGHTYRVAASRWAGGNHSVSVAFSDDPANCAAVGNSARIWSSNGKWSGNNSRHNFRISRRLPLQMAVIGGLVTLDCTQIGPREYRAVWAEQARGFDLKIVHGYIIRGYHVAANDLIRARRIAAVARAKTLSTRIAERSRIHADRALNTVWVSIDDSLRAGNCAPATKSVASQIRQALGGDVYAVRADYLLHVRNDQFARRAIAAAQHR